MRALASCALILASQISWLSQQASAVPVGANIVTSGSDDDSDIGKTVAWVIAILISVILMALVLAYCICSRMEHDSPPQNKQFVRSMSLATMMKSQIREQAINAVTSPRMQFGGSQNTNKSGGLTPRDRTMDKSNSMHTRAGGSD